MPSFSGPFPVWAGFDHRKTPLESPAYIGITSSLWLAGKSLLRCHELLALARKPYGVFATLFHLFDGIFDHAVPHTRLVVVSKGHGNDINVPFRVQARERNCLVSRCQCIREIVGDSYLCNAILAVLQIVSILCHTNQVNIHHRCHMHKQPRHKCPMAK